MAFFFLLSAPSKIQFFRIFWHWSSGSAGCLDHVDFYSLWSLNRAGCLTLVGKFHLDCSVLRPKKHLNNNINWNLLCLWWSWSTNCCTSLSDVKSLASSALCRLTTRRSVDATIKKLLLGDLRKYWHCVINVNQLHLHATKLNMFSLVAPMT